MSLLANEKRMNLFTTITLLLLPILTFSQVNDDFSGGSLAPWWQGDRENFILSDNQLQLNAPDGGSTYLYTEIADADSLSISMKLEMAFAPSTSNGIDIVLISDEVDYASANAVVLRIGESGSDDALQFISIAEGEETILATGEMGAVADDPVTLSFEVQVFGDVWNIYTDYEDKGFFEVDPELVVVEPRSWEGRFSGIFCFYTSSRTDKFYFDYFNFGKYTPDETAPSLVAHDILGPDELSLTFNEIVHDASATDVNNFNINGKVPDTVYLSATPSNTVILKLQEVLLATAKNIVTIENIQDISGNVMSPVTLEIMYARSPKTKDIVVNEVLTDPVGPGSDFVEFFNRTEEFLALDGCEIVNTQNDDRATIESITLAPGSYIAFTDDKNYLLDSYSPPADAVIQEQDIPSFNNDEANFSLQCNGVTIDSFDYFATYHLSVLDDTEGISLERISVDEETNLQNNWHSAAASVFYGTPGYENSTFYDATAEEMFTLQSSSFSPNQDGEEDIMILEYNLDTPGYVINTQIYDSEGYRIKRLQNNQNLGSQGLITWDGIDDNGALADIGIYIVVGELFHPDGNTLMFKKVVALVDYLD